MRLAETRILVYRTSLYVKSFPRSNVKTPSLMKMKMKMEMKMMKVCFTLETFEKRKECGNHRKLLKKYEEVKKTPKQKFLTKNKGMRKCVYFMDLLLRDSS